MQYMELKGTKSRYKFAAEPPVVYKGLCAGPERLLRQDMRQPLKAPRRVYRLYYQFYNQTGRLTTVVRRISNLSVQAPPASQPTASRQYITAKKYLIS